MIIKEKWGNLKDVELHNRTIDFLPLEWHQRNKRILHKKTASGKEVILKFLKETPDLSQDDIVYANEKDLIVIDILPCPVLVIHPNSMYEMAVVCYEIGNKHLPLFYEGDELLIPYEAPIFRMLTAGGFAIKQENRKLLHPLRTSVLPHTHTSNKSLFSKILQLTAAHEK